MTPGAPPLANPSARSHHPADDHPAPAPARARHPRRPGAAPHRPGDRAAITPAIDFSSTFARDEDYAAAPALHLRPRRRPHGRAGRGGARRPRRRRRKPRLRQRHGGLRGADRDADRRRSRVAARRIMYQRRPELAAPAGRAPRHRSSPFRRDRSRRARRGNPAGHHPARVDRGARPTRPGTSSTSPPRPRPPTPPARFSAPTAPQRRPAPCARWSSAPTSPSTPAASTSAVIPT